MELFTQLAEWSLTEGYKANIRRGESGNFMGPGTRNAKTTGDGITRASRGPLLLEGLIGSRQFFNSDQSYGGLGDAATNGVGSLFNIRQLLAYIGAGQVCYNGAELATIIASSTPSFLAKTGDDYIAGPDKGPFQWGHAQPGAPIIYAKSSPSAGKPAMSGAVVIYTWRISAITGQVSLASLPSNVVVLSDQTVIAQVGLVDLNGQTHWGFGGPKVGFIDLGVGYQFPTSLDGEVAEATLAYTRAVAGASIGDGTNTVDVTEADPDLQFTSADVGRRIAFSTFDSWITQVNTAQQVEVYDMNDSGGTISGAATVTHAIDGYTRAVELSWTNLGLVGMPIVPDKAFPPGSGQFAGAIMDTLWLDDDGIIYIGEPNQIGSFPPKNAAFANGPAVVYVRSGKVVVRFGKNNVGALYYVGGSPAIEYQTIMEHQGLVLPQNAGLGFNGRLLAWFGKPTVVNGIEPDFGYANDVLPDFAGWNENQSVNKPIVARYDGIGQYECWCFGTTIMAKHGPTGAWCSPEDLSDVLPGNIMDGVTVDHKLYLSVKNDDELEIWQYDAGSGSVMLVYTAEKSRMSYSQDITLIMSEGSADNIDHPVIIEVVKNYDRENPIADPIALADAKPVRTGSQLFTPREPNVIDAQQFGLKITATSIGGLVEDDGSITECSLSRIAVFGSEDEVLRR